MNKSTIYITIISLLLICNGIFAYLFFSKPDHPPHQHPREVIIEKLNFNEDQIESYDKLIIGHREEITSKEKELRELKDKLYALVLDENSSDEANQLANQIGNIHIEIEHINFQHFQDLHNLCSPDQEADFKELVNDLGKIFAPAPPPPKKKK